MKYGKAIILLSIFSFFILADYSVAYVTSIHAPAVIVNESIGTLTTIQLNLTHGNGAVTVTGPLSVGASTIESAEEAVAYATKLLLVNQSHYNFSFYISDKGVNVSGPSAGAAFTLLTMAALEHAKLLNNFTISGTIQPNGSIGLIGGVYDKAMAASRNHMRFFILPYSGNGTLEQLLYYISQQVFNIPIVQVDNVTQAISYALGTAKPEPMLFNITTQYRISGLPESNITCASCNTSIFAKLTNYTLNFTDYEINKIPSNFSSAKQQMLENLNQYRAIASKGYLYTAADLAYLQYIDAFTLANMHNYTPANASDVVSNISAYCSSLVPPPITNTNYEYVVGGELRQELANETLQAAQAMLNSSEVTSDTYIEALYSSAEALGWCKAAAFMYNASSQLGGSFVAFSPVLKSEAASEINKAEAYGSNIYLSAALASYNTGNYGPALYAAVYADVLGNPYLAKNLSNAQLVNATLLNIKNASVGIWPSQFASEAEFYLDEYMLFNKSTLNTAYQTSTLASALAYANNEIEKAMIVSNYTAVPQQLTQQISNMSNEINGLFALLLVVLILLFAILVILLVQLVNNAAKKNEMENKKPAGAKRLTISRHTNIGRYRKIR